MEQHVQSQAESGTTVRDLESLDVALLDVTRQEANLAKAIAMTANADAMLALVGRLDQLAGQKRTLQTERQTLLDLQAAKDRISSLLDSLSDAVDRRYAEIEAMTIDQKRDVLADFGVVATVYPKDAPFRWEIDLAFDLEAFIGDAVQDDPPAGMAGTVAEWMSIAERPISPAR